MNTWQFRFIKLTRGRSHVGHLHFFLFTLNYLSKHSNGHTGLIFFISWNLPYYFHFVFFLFVWLMKLKSVLHPSHYQDYFRGPYVILRGWKGGPWSPELLGGPKLEADLIWKRGTWDPSLYHDRCLTGF